MAETPTQEPRRILGIRLPDWEDVYDVIPDAMNFVKNQLIYMTGRGLLGTAIWGIGIMFGGAEALLTGPAATVTMGAVVAATVGLQAYKNYRNERFAEQRMVSIFRDEVAAKLDMPQEEVTLDHLKTVADGSLNRGIPANPVIQQALNHNGKKHLLQIVTTAFAGFSTLAILFAVPGLTDVIGGWREALTSGILGASDFVGITGLMFASGAGMSLLNKAYDYAGEHIFNIHHKTAYELINEIRTEVNRGRSVSPQKVFEVYVAADPSLGHAIEERFGVSYHDMEPQMQHSAMLDYADMREVLMVTQDINGGHIQTEELAFITVGQHSGVERIETPPQRVKEEISDPYQKLVNEIKKEIGLGDKPQQPEEQKQPAAEFPPANDNVPGFAERFAPRDPQQEVQSFAEKVRGKETPLSNHLERELQKALQNKTDEPSR
jgi:hypothetical protein